MLPTMTKLALMRTDTGCPSISIVVRPLTYQPREPVENSLTSAICGTPPMLTVIGLALARKSVRLMGQVVFLEPV